MHKRGTWFSNAHGRWYELDGFVVRRRERCRMVWRMCSVEEQTLSDHKPKLMVIKTKNRRRRVEERGRRVPRIEWEKLRRAEVKEEYARVMEENG